MNINMGKLLLFILIAFLGQYAIYYFVSMLPISPLAVLVVSDILIGFFFAFLYYPREARKTILRNPNFYRDAGIMAFIFLIIDVCRVLL